MTRRNLHAAQLAALALTGTACYLARTHWITSLILIYLACLTVWCAGCIAQHEQRMRARRGQPNAVGVPCCSFFRHSEGAVHGPDCTRPPLPRRDTYRMDEPEQAAFQRLAAAVDTPNDEHGSAA